MASRRGGSDDTIDHDHGGHNDNDDPTGYHRFGQQRWSVAPAAVGWRNRDHVRVPDWIPDDHPASDHHGGVGIPAYLAATGVGDLADQLPLSGGGPQCVPAPDPVEFQWDGANQ